MNRPGYGEEAPPPPVSEYGSGYGGEQQEFGYGSGYDQEYGRSKEEGYGGRRQEYETPSYGGEEEPRRSVYGRSEYGGVEEEEPRRESYGSYGRSEEEQPRRYGESGDMGGVMRLKAMVAVNTYMYGKPEVPKSTREINSEVCSELMVFKMEEIGKQLLSWLKKLLIQKLDYWLAMIGTD